MSTRPVWEQISDCDVLLPPSSPPKAIIHFTGGLGAGAAPVTLYSTFLSRLASRADVAIVATPIGASFDHDAIALSVARESGAVIASLQARYSSNSSSAGGSSAGGSSAGGSGSQPSAPPLPVIGVGHSLGAKIHALASSAEAPRAALGPPRTANVLIAFNNYSAPESIPNLNRLRDAVGRGAASIPPEVASILEGVADAGSSADTLRSLGLPAGVASFVSKATRTVADISEGIGAGGGGDGGFKPDEAEVLRRIGAEYSVPRTLVIAYTRDTIDCSGQLLPVLRSRFGDGGAVLRELPGTHITPNTPDIDPSFIRQTGFDAVDAAVGGAADATMAELDDTVTVIAAFIAVNLQLLDQRLLSA